MATPNEASTEKGVEQRAKEMDKIRLDEIKSYADGCVGEYSVLAKTDNLAELGESLKPYWRTTEEVGKEKAEGEVWFISKDSLDKLFIERCKGMLGKGCDGAVIITGQYSKGDVGRTVSSEETVIAQIKKHDEVVYTNPKAFELFRKIEDLVTTLDDVTNSISYVRGRFS